MAQSHQIYYNDMPWHFPAINLQFSYRLERLCLHKLYSAPCLNLLWKEKSHCSRKQINSLSLSLLSFSLILISPPLFAPFSPSFSPSVFSRYLMQSFPGKHQMATKAKRERGREREREREREKEARKEMTPR